MNDRLSKLRILMLQNNVDAVLISSVSNIFYISNFSGFSKEDRDAFILITKKMQYIFTHAIYKDVINKNLNNYKLIELMRDKPINHALNKIIKKHKIKKIGVEAFDLSALEYLYLQKHISKKSISHIDFINKLRINKSENEIQNIKKSCRIGDQVYAQILKYIKTNITEKEIAFAIDSLIRKSGAEPSFQTIVAFGKNAAYPHHVPSDAKLKRNSFVLMDFGVKLKNYCSDMTRTVFFGKASKEQKNAYQTVLVSQQKAIEFLISHISSDISDSKSIKTSDVDKVARKHIESEDYPTIPHSLGHGIGLEVHEAPRLSPQSKDNFENGMVFSIEPGIYLENRYGIRIEDLFAIKNYKLLSLTSSPKELIEV